MGNETHSHVFIVSGKLRSSDRFLAYYADVLKGYNLIIATDRGEEKHIEKFRKAGINVHTTFCEDFEWAVKANACASVNKHVGLFQWVKYKLACEKLSRVELSNGSKFFYVHKIRTDCDYRCLSQLTSREHIALLQDKKRIYCETDYSWSAQRECAMMLSGMYKFFVDDILPTRGSFRLYSPDVEHIEKSTNDFWKFSSFLTAVRKAGETEADWEGRILRLTEQNIHSDIIKSEIVQVARSNFENRYEDVREMMAHSKFPDDIRPVSLDPRAGFNDLVYFRFFGHPTAPSEVALAHYLNRLGILVGRSPALLGFPLPDRR